MARSDAFLKALKATDNIRNIAICAHIDHGKTTFCDGLLAGAGMMSEELAGTSRQLDSKPDEIERGITIDSAATSMLFRFPSADYLINLIDTPGHVDFGGDVTRAMHAVDGCIVIVDAVEGIMPQTETVLRQALKEYVKPILFINKVDRLIRELKVTPQQMQERFTIIIDSVNKFISQYAPKEFSQDWQVSVTSGSVLFGSAAHNWALSLAIIKDKSVSLSQIIEEYNKGADDIKRLRRIVPLHECVIQAIISHLPSPKQAATYRINHLWQGDKNSELSQSLQNCDPSGPVIFVVTKVELENGSELSTGRLFSGTLSSTDTIFALNANTQQKIAQIYVRNGAKKEQITQAYAGNIISLSGIDVTAGETLSTIKTTPFKEISHLFEPVITQAIEPLKPSELPQLEIALKQMQKEDPGIIVEINKETGEYLISGQGELHLEVIANRIRDVKKISVKSSEPIIVYREEPSHDGSSEQKSSLDSSHVKISAMPLSEEEIQIISSHPNGICTDDSMKDLKFVYRTNCLCAHEKIAQSILDAFCDIMRRGPLAGEPCYHYKINIEIFHGDNPGVMYPLFKEALRQAILATMPHILEPIQEMQFDAPSENISDITNLVNARKGNIMDVLHEVERITIFATIPVSNSLGLTGDLRARTNGRGSSSIRKQFFARVDEKDQIQLVQKLRQKKGLFI